MSKDKNRLYKIIFTDGTTFDGGNLIDTNWLQIPYNKKIKQIFFKLPTGDYLLMSNYEKYYFMVECVENVNTVANKQIENVYLMGQRKSNILCYKIDLYKNVGSIYTVLLKDDSDFIKGLNPKGWKKGISLTIENKEK